MTKKEILAYNNIQTVYELSNRLQSALIDGKIDPEFAMDELLLSAKIAKERCK